MHLQRLEQREDPYYASAMALYEFAFPRVERRDEDEQMRVMTKSDYHFDIIVTEDGFGGIALYWETEDFLFLEHLATLPDLRGRGLGSMALSLLKNKGKAVILEIEPPIDALTRRRRGFYERNGFQVTPHDHLQTKFRLDDEDLPLMVLSYPHVINAEEYRHFYAYLQREVACRPRSDERRI
jgi:GNAT superfamily N-acetyltransferase